MVQNTPKFIVFLIIINLVISTIIGSNNTGNELDEMNRRLGIAMAEANETQTSAAAQSAESTLGVNVMGHPILLFKNIFNTFIKGFYPFGEIDHTDTITEIISGMLAWFRFLVSGITAIFILWLVLFKNRTN